MLYPRANLSLICKNPWKTKHLKMSNGQYSTLFTFSISPPLKFLEALFVLQTTFITLSLFCAMIKSTKMISVFGILWKIEQKLVFLKSGIYKFFHSKINTWIMITVNNNRLDGRGLWLCLTWQARQTPWRWASSPHGPQRRWLKEGEVVKVF